MVHTLWRSRSNIQDGLLDNLETLREASMQGICEFSGPESQGG